MFVRLNDLMTAKVRYLFKKSNSPIFYYRRKIPDSLRPYYNNKQHLLISLKTTNEREAVSALQKVHLKIETEFKVYKAPSNLHEEATKFLKPFNLRLVPLEDQELHYCEDISQWDVLTWEFEKHSESPSDLTGAKRLAFDILTGTSSPKLQEGLSILLENPTLTKKKSQEHTRYVSYFIESLPTTEIEKIRTYQVQDAVKALYSQYKSATVKKYVQSARKAFRLVAKRYEIQRANPFEGIELITGYDEQSRITFTTDQLNKLSYFIRSRYQETATIQILGLLFNTGCRSSEVGGLMLSDIVLSNTPHFFIRPNPKRRLKTKFSERTVPLVGLSLSIAKHLVSTASPSQEYLFPRYCKNDKFAKESCNAAVNKMLKTVIPEGTSHSFRHALRDRLTNSGCLDSQVETIMGWFNGSMLGNYGKDDFHRIFHNLMQNMVEFERGTINSDIITS